MGATQTMELSRRPTWLVEICLNEFHPGGVNPNYAATFDLFWGRDYEARTADLTNTLITPTDVNQWTQAGCCESGVINYLFVPR